MVERAVQVPVSLIEELGAADDANEGERFYSALSRLRALLSQPTPTAEAQCTCYPVPEHLHTTHYGATDPATTLEPNPDCPVHFPTAQSSVARHLDYLAAYISPAPDAELLTAGANEIHALRRKVATLEVQLSSAIAVYQAEMRMLENRLERVSDWREHCFSKPSAVTDLLDKILRDDDIDTSTIRDVTPPNHGKR